MIDHDRRGDKKQRIEEYKKQRIKKLTEEIYYALRNKERGRFTSVRAMAKTANMKHNTLSWRLDNTPKADDRANTGVQRSKHMHLSRKSLIQIKSCEAFLVETRSLADEYLSLLSNDSK